ncbi:MAG: TIM barrel protein [Eubacteriales bacterium]|nr:TIM barrel protein [Eubacteriales bacterium]
MLYLFINRVHFNKYNAMYPTIEMVGKERIRKVLDENQLRLNCIICMETMNYPEEAAEAVQAAVDLSCEKIMLVPGRKEGSREELAQAMIESFTAYVKEADKYGITCVIEDDPCVQIPLCTREEMHRYFDSVPNLQMVYDTANMLLVNDDPIAYYREFLSYIKHMHIKDIRPIDEVVEYADVSIDGTTMLNSSHGTGVIDFAALFREFGKTQYDGTMALEFVPREDMDYAEDFKRVYTMFNKLIVENTIGVNQFGL